MRTFLLGVLLLKLFVSLIYPLKIESKTSIRYLHVKVTCYKLKTMLIIQTHRHINKVQLLLYLHCIQLY